MISTQRNEDVSFLLISYKLSFVFCPEFDIGMRYEAPHATRRNSLDNREHTAIISFLKIDLKNTIV